MMTTEAYPLHWPMGWPRTEPRVRKWRLPGGGQSWNRVMARLKHELRLLGAKNIVVSTDQPLRRDGAPYAAKRRTDEPGAAVYFTLKGRQLVMAQDAYELLLDNLRSLALAIGNLRGLERHGGGTMLERAFTGFEALPAPDDWRDILELDPRATAEDVDAAYRRLAKTEHPDAGGTSKRFRRIQGARDDGLRALG